MFPCTNARRACSRRLCCRAKCRMCTSTTKRCVTGCTGSEKWMRRAMSNAIEAIVAEHAEEAAFLWLQRAAAVHQPQYAPDQFADLDGQLEAQIDGLRVAGP